MVDVDCGKGRKNT